MTTNDSLDRGGVDRGGVDCGVDRRRDRVRARRRNGVDSVEVSDDGLTLTVTFLGKAPKQLQPANIRIDGGRRVRGIVALDVRVESHDEPGVDDRVHIAVNKRGDTSTYELSVVVPDAYGRPGTEPYPGFDVRYHRARFDFQGPCPSDVDCAAVAPRPVPVRPSPAVNYTARDYESLRRLLLDRLVLTVPEWVERHAPDLGVTLVEVLAYVGDQLSYYQDAVATEAYLDTARSRVSVRRHTRLVDYAMHDGCNARTFVVLETTRNLTLSADDFRFAAIDVSHLDPVQRPKLGPVLSDEELERLPPGTALEIFEPLVRAPLTVRRSHNTIRLWTWGDAECCLPRGSTSATLRDEWVPQSGSRGSQAGQGEGEGEGDDSSGAPTGRDRVLRLAPGDLLVFEEVRGPRTGAVADADPRHRQAVRLISVTPAVDELYDQPVLEVTWAVDDALAFDLCLSARGGPNCCLIEDVSVARGNVVLVDHGRGLTACGGAPEEITTPPAPVSPPDCAPPAFGCPDRREDDPAVALVQSLIRQTDERTALTPDVVRELNSVLGEPAVSRAGIVIRLEPGQQNREVVLPGTTPEQNAALRSLLAQVTYPPLRPRFRPVLRYAPVTQRVPFPLPTLVAAGQAEILVAIPDRVRARLEELWRQVRGGRPPTPGQLGELTILFGEKVLADLNIGERPVEALRELLARRAELLWAKVQRLAVLVARARAGTVLDEGIVWEITQSWGVGYAGGLHPESTVLAGSARSAVSTDPRAALPAVVARTREARFAVEADKADKAEEADEAGESSADVERWLEWTPRRDLLASGPRDRHFVGELEEGPDGVGRLALRFGDGRHGARPPAGATFEVAYRVGNGVAGNVGPEAINHLVLCCAATLSAPDEDENGSEGSGGDVRSEGVTRVRNPLAAVGGIEPEPMDEVRQLAPLAPRRTLLRAVTPADYAELAARVPGVRRAAAEIRWTGSGREVRVAVVPATPLRSTVDRHPANTPRPALLEAVARELETVRRIGHAVAVGPARLVPLDVELTLCVAPGYQRGHVLTAVRAALGTGVLPDGRLGLFHPDLLGFGEPVRVSRLVAVTAAVPGIVSARVTRLRRRFGRDTGELADGLLRLGPLEIAQLDNDPDRPENGRLSLVIGGGR
ncbi:putative baseplate assembly protein [Streptoalloteichus hindustanus]|uniref:Putative baseplate assembly protein n=1 Tax=Streptoalloteichus hindustanus TaxID=2017 RepID=A0A1M4YVV1_STRHI|nr:putative baseplate assembly protein [Streptoalloteichus hindustanus]SHF09923.1 putative baseplate assembly protein [Streptoalloteichus hindustanus]